jgi:TonB-dependent receptor
MGTFASTGLPVESLPPGSPAASNPEGTCAQAQTLGCWEITELVNGPGATVKGLELGFQAPLTSFHADLPPVIRGLGFIANFTLLESESPYPYLGNVVTGRMFELSNRSFNATLYYEDSKFAARLSAAHRSDYSVNGPTYGNLWQFVDSSTHFDFWSSYNLIDELDVTFEVRNLTNEPFYAKVDIDANRLLDYRKTGRNYLLGARFTY